MVMAQSYIVEVISMDLDNLSRVIPSRLTCYELIRLIEAQYECCIKFWLSIEKPPNSEVRTRVHLTGSGLVFDLVYSDNGPPTALVLESQGGNLYAALWSVLIQLEAQFRRVMRPSIYPPIS